MYETMENPILHYERRVYNPVQKDYATFLKTAAETNGELSLLEVELAPHGGNFLHYHTEFSEAFEVLEGELHVQVGEEYLTLQPGEFAVAQPGEYHRFFSVSDTPTRFRVEIRPGHPGFENALRIGYGLASDGLTDANGLPKRMLDLAYLGKIGGTKAAGLFSLVLTPVAGLLALVAHRKGIDKELEERYLQAF
jgi:quercetin dioxygenase-like cupin family protein